MTPVWFLSLVVLAAAAPATPLATAEDLVAQVRYADAEKALVLARAQPGNSRETLLKIVELQGIVAATLGQGPKARGFFQVLLTLDPSRKLPDSQPPRVKTPFYEAKGIASEAPPMTFSTSSDSGPDGSHLHAQLSADGLGLAKKVRFHQRDQGAAAWVDKLAPLVGGTASIVAGLGRIDWWAELLGEQDAVLLSAGSEEKPFVDGAPAAAPPAVADAPVAPAPVAAETSTAPSGPSRFSPAVIALLAGAVAATAGGVVFGVLSRGSTSQVDTAATNSVGVVTGLTQRQAATLRSSATTQAIVANVCFGAAIALAGTGVVVFLLNGPSQVALAPSPNGVVLVGHFP